MLHLARVQRPAAGAGVSPIRATRPPPAPFTTTTTSTSDTSSSTAADPDGVAADVATLLSRCSGDWKLAIAASDLPSRLSPAALSSLLRRRNSSPHLHPKLLLDFFYWSRTRLSSVRWNRSNQCWS